MSKLNESQIEDFSIGLLKELGYSCIHGPDIAPDADAPLREKWDDVVLVEKLRDAVARINPNIPESEQEEAIKQIQRLNSPDLLANNENFHRLLTEGVNVTVQKGENQRGDYVKLVDFDEPENNDFAVINQFTVIENNVNKRPDMVLFVNGLPLVVIELKNAVDENASCYSAFKQLGTYKAQIPALFNYNTCLIISDGLEAKAGTLSSDFTRFLSWKTQDGKTEASSLVSQLEVMIKGMLNKTTFLDLIRHFIVFEKTKKEDKKTGQISILTIKKIAAYHQYYAVNKAVESTLRAAAYQPKKNQNAQGLIVGESPEAYGLPGVKKQPAGDKKGGVVWHTQGSGKSLSMVFYTGKMVLAMDNPTVVVITDRNDLDDQLFDTFAASRQLLRQEPVQAENRDHVKRLLKVASGGIVFTTIQKFQPDEGNVYETLSTRSNIIVVADEAHRTQYGFKAKTIDHKDKDGHVIGKKTVYGFAKYMRDALPKATYLGFTGTPIEKDDVNTAAVFGNYVDIYDIAMAVNDGATVRIYYESRLAKVALSDQGRQLVKELDDELIEENLSEAEKAKAKWTQIEALIGSKDRLNHVAADMVKHFEQRQIGNDGKAMIVSMSRRIAAELYAAIIKIRPDWHSKDLDKGAIKVVMTAASSDGPQISAHHTTKDERRALAERMKDPDDELKLVIVRDMWLTGFDVPCLHTLYIDKPMKGHNLMQAIARVNRVYRDKVGGLIVDYLGIAADLKQALSFYSESGGKGDPAAIQQQAVSLMLEKLEIVSQMYHGYEYEKYFDSDTRVKLQTILEAEEHILGLENGRKRYIDEVTALSKAFSIALPHDQAMDAKDEIGFFQAVKARLLKFDSTASGKSSVEMETAIRQVIDQALVSDKVIDVFDAAGLKKPEISVLSEDFLLEVKNMKHQNIAIEVLKKLLNDEIKARMKQNLVQSKSLMEMLEDSIKRYQAKILDAAEFISELIEMSKEIQKMDKEPQALNLTSYEYAFYTAVANNDSARELMDKDKLRELAVVLYKKVKESATIDWTIKDNVRAGMKVAVKRLLRQFGYPPDMQKLATETVLKQAEMIAQELVDE